MLLLRLMLLMLSPAQGQGSSVPVRILLTNGAAVVQTLQMQLAATRNADHKQPRKSLSMSAGLTPASITGSRYIALAFMPWPAH